MYKQIADIEEWLESQDWIYAKTYSSFAPHFYLKKDNLPDKDKAKLFQIMKYIYSEGKNVSVVKKWNRYWWYLFIGGHKYWFHAKKGNNNNQVSAMVNKKYVNMSIIEYFNKVKVFNRE